MDASPSCCGPSHYLILLHWVSRAHLGSIFRTSFFPIVPSQHKTSLKPAWSAFGCRSSGRCHDATLLNSVVWLSCINHFFICTLTQQDHTGCPFCYNLFVPIANTKLPPMHQSLNSNGTIVHVILWSCFCHRGLQTQVSHCEKVAEHGDHCWWLPAPLTGASISQI